VTLQAMIPDCGCASLPAGVSATARSAAKDRQREARLAAIDTQQLSLALFFIAGFSPVVFDAALDAVEPCDADGAPDRGEDLEPYCTLCLAPVGVFLKHGDEWHHFRGAPSASKPEPYETDHDPVIAWRPAPPISDRALR
jgi:hypothetical protein